MFLFALVHSESYILDKKIVSKYVHKNAPKYWNKYVSAMTFSFLERLHVSNTSKQNHSVVSHLQFFEQQALVFTKVRPGGTITWQNQTQFLRGSQEG